ncbi:MAG: hypothetical protein WKG07_38510 [Hymenobacter sp.]
MLWVVLVGGGLLLLAGRGLPAAAPALRLPTAWPPARLLGAASTFCSIAGGS